jgi:hypothetical protein
MENRNGDLFTHNLWSFWESISLVKRTLIIESFKSSKGLFWDYNSLFQGMDKLGNLENGDIHLLNMILNIDDIDLCDACYEQFLTYKPVDYLSYSFWGSNWENKLSKLKKPTKGEMLLIDCGIMDFPAHRLEYYNSLSQEIIYWKDAHFFIANYSARVYKNYLNGACNIERFEKAVNFEYNYSDIIHYSILKIFNSNLRNRIFDQFLIYLEKDKKFQKCINLMNDSKFLKWNNDYSKRLIRCNDKLEKTLRNGNKS